MSSHSETRAQRSLPREVMAGLMELVMNYRQRILEVVATLDLSPPQAFLLRHIEPGSKLTMGALAELLACDASNVTGLVDRLEARGFIERLALPHDRRVKAIALTKSGIETRERFIAGLLTPTDDLEAMPDRDLKSTIAALSRLSAALGGDEGAGACARSAAMLASSVAASHSTSHAKPVRAAKPARVASSRP